MRPSQLSSLTDQSKGVAFLPMRSPAEIAEAIRRVATHSSATEMDLMVGIEEIIRPLLGPGVSLSRYQQSTRLGGIKDALHGQLIIEYERPGKLKTTAGYKEAVGQLKRYLREDAPKESELAAAAMRRMVGVAIDGRNIIFVRSRGSVSQAILYKAFGQISLFPELDQTDEFSVDDYDVTTESIDLFLGYLQSLARFPLTPDALAATFGPRSDVARKLVGALYKKVQTSDSRRVQTFFSEWQRIFGIVYGQDVDKAEEEAMALGNQFGVKKPHLKEFLFSVHTYFALLMKFLAAEIMTLQRGSLLQSFIQPLASQPSAELKSELKDLEEGGLFSRQEITNFLEGDFFSWYLAEWDADLGEGIRQLAKTLALFDASTPYLAPEHSRDLLKKLYQYLVPKKLRHDLGEYYTPDWLAEHVLDEIGYDGNLDSRFLDPACGSGTFLVLAMKRAKQWGDQHDPPIPLPKIAQKILTNLVGFDLNPIAVIAARTNFLLAMGELIRYVRPIEIPIYICDAVLTPVKHKSQSVFPELQRGYEVVTRAGTFVIPREIVNRGVIDRFAGILEDCIRHEDLRTSKKFVSRIKREIGLEDAGSAPLLVELHDQMMELEKQNRNRIWARFIKNSFAPVFKSQKRFDFVVGNPPWVNWENLADEYREETKKLWRDYGFFTQRGYRAAVPAGKLELAALFTFVAADAYLSGDGKLAFVITQSIFKTKGAGEGFRKFRLPDDVYLGVTHVDDLVELKPFEGAQNRTATLVLSKGMKTAYPIKYTVWRSSPAYLGLRRATNYEPELSKVLGSTDRIELYATPVDRSRIESPWLTSTKVAIQASEKVVGRSSYRAREGVNTEGANSVYWVKIIEQIGESVLVQNIVDGAKKKVKQLPPTSVESELVYPLLRGRDVSRWNAEPSVHMIVTHSPGAPTRPYDDFESLFPKAHKYLSEFRSHLKKRSLIKKLKWDWCALGKIGPYTFSPFKVVWGEVGNDLAAAVISTAKTRHLDRKCVIPDHTVIMVPCKEEDEAHFLAAQLNSVPARLVIRGYIVLHPSPHVLEQVRLVQFDRKNNLHVRLASLGREAHDVAMNDEPKSAEKLRGIEQNVDELSSQLWGLSLHELEQMRSAITMTTREKKSPQGVLFPKSKPARATASARRRPRADA